MQRLLIKNNHRSHAAHLPASNMAATADMASLACTVSQLPAIAQRIIPRLAECSCT